MLDQDALLEAEADSLQLFRLAGAFAEEPPHVREIARRLNVRIVTERGARVFPPREADISKINGTWTIHLLMKMDPARESWIIGHELGHWYYRTRGMRPALEEWRCDAIGACLVAPRPPFLEATQIIGHHVHELARAFETTQSLALLRLGEVTGRPVALLRGTATIVRGSLFEWGSSSRSLPRSIAHPIRVDGEWGMMADRWWAMTA